MELRINPSEEIKVEPFVVKIDYNETLENLIYTISLTITTVPISSMRIFHKGRALKNLNSKISQNGISFGDTIDLRAGSGFCCIVF